MDEMKIGSKFTTNFNELKATFFDVKTHVHLDIDAYLEKDELSKILKTIGL